MRRGLREHVLHCNKVDKKDTKGRTPMDLARKVHGDGSIVVKRLNEILLQ